MKTFAVVKALATRASYFVGHEVSPRGDGKIIRGIGVINGTSYGHYMTLGAGLRDTAEETAREIGGFVVEMEGGWANDQMIRDAIRDQLPALVA